MGNFDNPGNLGDPGDDADHPASGGDWEQVYRLDVRSIESARECLEPWGLPEESLEHTIMADGVVHAALRRLFAGLDIGACRYPIHLHTLQDAVLGMLISAGVPGSDLHAAVAAATKAYYGRTDRAADAELPAPLLRIYKYLRAGAGRRQLRVYRDGTAWGATGPVIILGRLPLSDEYYFALDADDPETLVLGKNPVWPGEYHDLRLDLRAEVVFERIAQLTRGPQEWGEEPSQSAAAWEENWDAWAAAESGGGGWGSDAADDPDADRRD